MIPPTNAANRTNYDLIPFSISQRPDKIASSAAEQISTSTDSQPTSIKAEAQATVPSRSRATKMESNSDLIKSGIGQNVKTTKLLKVFLA